MSTATEITSWEIAEIHPIASVFRLVGTADFYLVKVKGNPHKGHPWVVANTRQSTPGQLEISTAWFRTKKAAYREFREFRREIAHYSTAPVDQFKTVSF